MCTLEVELHHVFVNRIKTIYFVKVRVNILIRHFNQKYSSVSSTS